MSPEKRSSPFWRAIMSLILGIGSMSFTLSCLFVSDELAKMFYAAHIWSLVSPLYLLLELPAIVMAVVAILVGNAARPHCIFLRDERLIITGLCLSYLALIVTACMIFVLPGFQIFQHIFREHPASTR
jgi:hypothetical protein